MSQASLHVATMFIPRVVLAFARFGTLPLVALLLSGCGVGQQADYVCYGSGQAQCAGSWYLCRSIREQCQRKVENIGMRAFDQAEFTKPPGAKERRRARIRMASGHASGSIDLEFTRDGIRELTKTRFGYAFIFFTLASPIVVALVAGFACWSLRVRGIIATELTEEYLSGAAKAAVEARPEAEPAASPPHDRLGPLCPACGDRPAATKPAGGFFKCCCRTCEQTSGIRHCPECQTLQDTPIRLRYVAQKLTEEILAEESKPSDLLRYTKPDAIWEALDHKGAPVILVSGAWLVGWAKAGRVLPRRQELPPEAVMPTARLKAIWQNAKAKKQCALPIVAISYCWLTAAHPDPAGKQLKCIAAMLEKETNAKEGYAAWGFEDVGVFWDWASLHQKDTAGKRSEGEWVLFNKALSATMDLWYTHQLTIVYLCTAHFEQGVDYAKRGWTLFERSGAELVKKGQAFLLDFQMCREIGADASEIISREAPMPPTLFAEEVARRHFTNRGDKATLVTMYTGMVVRILRSIKELDLSGTKLSSTGAGARFGQALSLCSNLSFLNLHGCQLGNVEILNLARHLCTNALPALAQLILTRNGMQAEALEAILDTKDRGVMPMLVSLDIGGNCIRDEGTIVLAERIKKGSLQSVKKLILNECLVGDEGCIALAEVLAIDAAPDLEELGISFNAAITDAGVSALTRTMNAGTMKRLKKLEIVRFSSYKQLGHDNKNKLAEACAKRNTEVRWVP